MAQVAFTIRMDENLKRIFDNQCAKFGMSATTAFNVFANEVVRRGEIPFRISSRRRERGLDEEFEPIDLETWKAVERLRESARRNGTSDMSIDEINEVINKTRMERVA